MTENFYLLALRQKFNIYEKCIRLWFKLDQSELTLKRVQTIETVV